MTIVQETLPFEIFEEEMISPLAGVDLTEQELFVASLLLDATSDRPIKQAEVIEQAEKQKGERLTNREVRKIVRSLRRTHGFPICSRKGAPAGYWWGRTEDELAEFAKVFFAQIEDEAQTVGIMLRKNYPRLAGQMRLNLGLGD